MRVPNDGVALPAERTCTRAIAGAGLTPPAAGVEGGRGSAGQARRESAIRTARRRRARQQERERRPGLRTRRRRQGARRTRPRGPGGQERSRRARAVRLRVAEGRRTWPGRSGAHRQGRDGGGSAAARSASPNMTPEQRAGAAGSGTAEAAPRAGQRRCQGGGRGRGGGGGVSTAAVAARVAKPRRRRRPPEADSKSADAPHGGQDRRIVRGVPADPDAGVGVDVGRAEERTQADQHRLGVSDGTFSELVSGDLPVGSRS